MPKTPIKETIHAKGIDIGVYTTDFENEFISLTDIAKYRNSGDPRFVIQNWMRNRNTIEYLGIWEELHNPNFNRVQFEAVKPDAGLNRFVRMPSGSSPEPAVMAEERTHTAILPCPLPYGSRRSFSCTS